MRVFVIVMLELYFFILSTLGIRGESKKWSVTNSCCKDTELIELCVKKRINKTQFLVVKNSYLVGESDP